MPSTATDPRVAAAAPPAILARGLRKSYGDVVAVAGIDLTAGSGMCLGLLGPNGAGKTTTLEILEGLIRPDAGEVRLLGMEWGKDALGIRGAIGVQLQETRLTDKLTVFETIRLFRCFYDDGPAPDEVIEVIGLSEKRNARCEHLSGGQRQRLALGCALVNRPRILFLDEPTTGLDPQARRRVWEIIESFKQGGGTVLLSTHYMDEAERLADELVIIDRGRVIASGTPRDLIASMGADGVVELSGLSGAASPDAEELARIEGVRSVRGEGERVVLTVAEMHATLPRILAFLETRRTTLADLRTHRANLEDLFVSLTGRQLRDE